MTAPESPGGASYREAGVDYETLDAGKRLAIAGALSTSSLLAARGGHALDASRGEPAFVFELDGRTLAFVVEGLGTKSVIARQVLEAQGINRFGDVAYDTVAAILNDLCCVGALPLVVNAYFATGASEWYREGERARGADRGLAEGVRGRGLHLGGRGVAVAAGAAGRARDRAGGRRRRRRAGGPAAAPGRGARSRAMRSCWWPPAGCTPTAPRWRGCWRGGCRTATRPSWRGRRPTLRRGAAGAVGDVRGAGRGAAWRRSCRCATSATSPGTAC